MPEYSEAPEVAEVASTIVTEHHRELIDLGVRVEFVWRDEAQKSGGRVVLGKARKVSGLNAFLARKENAEAPMWGDDFFVIEIAEDYWQMLSESQREALVDHELSHCKVDKSKIPFKLRTVGHDCEEFVDIVRRHGLWKDDLKALNEAAKQHRLPGFTDASDVLKNGTGVLTRDSADIIRIDRGA